MFDAFHSRRCRRDRLAVMKALRAMIVLAALVSLAGCSKKEEAKGGSGGKAETKSGLAWEPTNYAQMSEPCKKALACCLEIAKSEGAKEAMDFNGKCSGPAMWKDDECTMDLKSRATLLEGKTVPDACK
jgi:hypothetical protein